MGPGTSETISFSTSSKLRPTFATSDGLVVTPSQSPMASACLISRRSAESMKNCMESPFLNPIHSGGALPAATAQKVLYRSRHMAPRPRARVVRRKRRAAAPSSLRDRDLIESGRTVIAAEASAIAAVPLTRSFAQAVRWILGCRGRVVVTGMGKPGFVAQKISATLASTGTPSLYLHPAEAAHGDLGRVARDDVVLALSNSGETEEILRLLPAFEKIGARVVALTREVASPLARAADLVLCIGAIEEACPMGLAPTASTAALLALGDALAMTVLANRSFDREEYALYHPGGKLGRGLARVREVMRGGEANPLVREDATLSSAV